MRVCTRNYQSQLAFSTPSIYLPSLHYHSVRLAPYSIALAHTPHKLHLRVTDIPILRILQQRMFPVSNLLTRETRPWRPKSRPLFVYMHEIICGLVVILSLKLEVAKAFDDQLLIRERLGLICTHGRGGGNVFWFLCTKVQMKW